MCRQLCTLLWLPKELNTRHVITAVTALIAAFAAMALPGPTNETTGMSSFLAVGAVALLAGHLWARAVVATAAVLLVGKLWPVVWANVATSEPLAARIALIAALPGLSSFAWTTPSIARLILGDVSSKIHGAGVWGLALCATLWLVVPAFNQDPGPGPGSHPPPPQSSGQPKPAQSAAPWEDTWLSVLLSQNHQSRGRLELIRQPKPSLPARRER